MRIIASALIEWSSHNSREAVDSWFKTELSGVASRRSVVARLTGPAGGRNEPRCEADVWHPFGYRPDDSIRRYFLLRLFSGQMPGMKPSPLQTSFFRAGHAHAGVLVILSLICQMFVEHAALGSGFAWLVRIGVPLAAILIPLGFFLSVAFSPDRPNGWIRSLYAGALVLAISVVVLGAGLIRA